MSHYVKVNDFMIDEGLAKWDKQDEAKISELVPTRHDLLQLVEDWYGEALSHEFFYFCNRSIGVWEARCCRFAHHLIDRIVVLIGEEDARKVMEEVETKFGEKENPRYWNVFLHGDKEQREALWEEFRQEFEEYYS